MWLSRTAVAVLEGEAGAPGWEYSCRSPWWRLTNDPPADVESSPVPWPTGLAVRHKLPSFSCLFGNFVPI